MHRLWVPSSALKEKKKKLKQVWAGEKREVPQMWCLSLVCNAKPSLLFVSFFFFLNHSYLVILKHIPALANDGNSKCTIFSPPPARCWIVY
jgi:hypothetical protein